MEAKVAAPPQKPDPETQKFEAAKASFEAAKKKTMAQEGLDTPEPKAAKEPKAEAPAEQPAPKAKPAKAAPKPVEPTALEKQIAALTARFDAAMTPKAPEPEPDEELEALRARLVQRFGEDEATDILDVMEARNGPMAKRIAQLEAVLAEATKSGRASISKANQKRLASDYPQVKSDAAWSLINQSVLADFEKDPKAYGSAEEAYDAKVATLYGTPESEDEESEESEEGAPEEVEEAASRIAASGMTTPGRARSERRTPEEKHRELHAYIMKHPDDKAGHRRLGRELGLRP